MGSFLGVIPIVVRRFAANFRLMLAVLVGAAVASALMSTTSIYTDAIHALGLSYALREAGPNNTNLLVRSTSQGSNEQTYRQNRDFIESSARQALGPVMREEPNSAGRSSTFFPAPPGGSVTTDELRPRSHLQFITNLEPHVRVVEGRMPQTMAPAPGRAPLIEVAIGVEAARNAGVRLGDTYDLYPFWAPEAAPVRANVVGTLEPVDLSDPYWLGISDLFSFPSRWPTLPFFVTQDTFFGSVAGYLPTMSSDYWSMLYVDTSRVDTGNAEDVRLNLEGYDRLLTSNLLRTTAITQLPQVLQSFDEKLFFTRIPLLVLVLQISGIVLYYLFMVSTMVVERQQGEIALLKSRGATTAQVMQIYVVEGLITFGVALAIGPPIAALVVGLLGHTPPFAGLSGGGNLEVALSLDAYLWAGAGALLAYLTLLWPAYQATRRTVVQQRTASARPPKESAFTRYYFDVALVGLGAILLYQLNRRGSLVTGDLFGEQSVDPVMLLTPAFFILTVGLVFLRLFPLALKLLAFVVSRAQGVAVLIGMWQLVRNPVHYSRLVLLLMLATAVGMFAASFGTTVNRSYEDRASYESGASLRLTGMRRLDVPGPASESAFFAEQYGARRTSLVFRQEASYGPNFDRVQVGMLGVDPASFGEVAYFRDDFAGPSLASMLDRLEQDEPSGGLLAIPPDARYLGVWLSAIDLRGRIGFDAEVRDANGRYFRVPFGPEAGYELSPGWVFLVADLSRPVNVTTNVQFANTPAEPPLELTSLSVNFITRVSALSGSFLIDDLIASPTLPAPLVQSRMFADPERRNLPALPNAAVIAGFDTAEGWSPVQGITVDRLNDSVRPVTVAGANALELQWRPVGGQPSTHGLRPAGNDAPIAAYASEAFLDQVGAATGDVLNLFVGGSFLDFEILGAYRLFPTLADPRMQPSLVVDGNRLVSAINAHPRSTATYADEIWMSTSEGTSAAVRDAVLTGRLSGTAFSLEELRDAQKKDPLVAAGWEGILFISFAAILLLSAIGFLIYSYLTAQRRTLEFAVLRTMGFSKGQIAMVVGFEQAFVIGLGIIAGTLFGLRLGGLMIRYMGVTETGDQVLPPMLLQVSWLTIGAAWLVLSAAFVVTIGIVILLYSRLALHRVLRIGET